MLVTLVGAGGSYPPPGYGGPSILVDVDGSPLLVDCGEDCLTGLSMAGYKPCDIDTVFLTHTHIDHWAGLPQLAVARIAEGYPRLRILAAPVVAGEASTLIPPHLPHSLKLAIDSISGYYSIEGYWARTVEMKHKVPTHGLIIEERGRVLLAVLSDTRPSKSIVEAVREAELVFHEATLSSSNREAAIASGHTTVTEFLDTATSISAGRVIAYHLSPESLSELRARLRSSRRRGVIVGVRGLQVSI